MYALGSTVLAVRFDAKTLQLIGGPVPVIEGVERTLPGTTAAAHFSVSNNGSIVYVPRAGSTDLGLVLVDRAGVRNPLNVPPAQYGHPRISPSGKLLAVHTEDEKDHVIWIYDLTGAASPRRLTFEGSNDRPVWTPDGERIAFRSSRDGTAATASSGSAPTATVGGAAHVRRAGDKPAAGGMVARWKGAGFFRQPRREPKPVEA